MKLEGSEVSSLPQGQISEFPDTRYMGSKRKLLPMLFHIFSQLDFQTVLDAFSGTSSVGYLLKKMGKTVVSNDYLRFNYHYAHAFIENSEVVLSNSDIERLIRIPAKFENFVEREFAGLYYSQAECRWLDAVLYNIDLLENPYKKSLALSALCRACIKKRPRGIFTYVGMRYNDGRRDLKLPLVQHFVAAAQMFNDLIFDNGNKHKVYNCDVLQLPTKKKFDLVYLDPPYFSLKSDNEYSRRYHFLEGLVSHWSHVEIDYSTKTKKIKRLESMFTHRNQIITAFEDIFSRYQKSQIVLSYSSNSYPDAETLKSLLKNEGKAVELLELDHIYSVGTHSHKKNNQSNRVKEYVFLGV